MKLATIKWRYYLITALFLLGLTILSIVIGTGELSINNIFLGQASAHELQILFVSRLPRTSAIILAGASLSIGGLIMQALAQNRFVEPSTTGVTESASMGLLLATLFLPNASLMIKMSVAMLFSVVGTFILMTVIRKLGRGQMLVVPLIGLILSGIIGAISKLIAWQYDLQGTLQAWSIGDFSGVLKGRYELIYIELILVLIAYLYAERFMIISLGKDISINLGVNYQRLSLVGLVIVAFIAAISLVIVGTLPFLGIVVPNIVSLLFGDHLKESLPLVAMWGAGFVLLSDIISRLLIYPAEVPVGVVIGVLGSGLFLMIIFYMLNND